VKFFTVIFSFYFLAISVLPCGDKKDCKNNATDQISLEISDHSEHEEDTEHCSPFCLCACCGTSYTNHSWSNVPDGFDLICNQAFLCYKSSLISEVFFSVWQPPNLN